MFENAYLIPLLPLAAAAVILLFGRWLPKEGIALAIGAAAVNLIYAVSLLVRVMANPAVLPQEGIYGRFFEMSRDWFTAGQFRMELGVMIDGMAAMMLVVVTLVSFLVQVYSLGYQHGKPRLGRYYAYLSFFTAAMLILVVANNLLQFFIGWELMGLSSYLLIGFEFERPAAAYASRKAFITTRIGDLGFYLGILLLFTALGTANFSIIGVEHVHALGPELATAIGLLLFCGAAGKSAQLPLHVWLPDAMEGPTPVSALIHAATMVAAGVFLLARFYFVFAAAPLAQTVVAWTGALTALGAALSALTATDIKKVLAYSTISQLGYMVLAMGVGNHQAGMFHLTTHAFFKALLFLGAGSVIHAVHSNEMPVMGGLGKKMPITFITMTCAWLAIIGFPYISSGFYSKEAILAAVYEKHQYGLFAIAAFTALLTTFYMTRLMILTFIGTPRDKEKFHHAHESGPSMTFPLILLAVLSLVSGFFLHYIWPFEHLVPNVLAEVAHTAEEHGNGHTVVLVTSLAALGLGLLSAYAVYIRRTPDPKALAEKFPKIHTLLSTRYFDALYLKLADLLCFKPAKFLAAFDFEVVDQGLIDGLGALARFMSRVFSWIDDNIVDGVFVNGWGWLSLRAGAGLRALQTGIAQNYLLAVALGVMSLLLWAVGVLG